MATTYKPTPEQVAQHIAETKKRYKILTGNAETLSILIEEHISTQDLNNRYQLYGKPFYDQKNGVICQCIVRNV